MTDFFAICFLHRPQASLASSLAGTQLDSVEGTKGTASVRVGPGDGSFLVARSMVILEYSILSLEFQGSFLMDLVPVCLFFRSQSVESHLFSD